MKKIIYNHFGGTEVLQITEAPMPKGGIQGKAVIVMD
jgi:hypothetical protein